MRSPWVLGIPPLPTLPDGTQPGDKQYNNKGACTAGFAVNLPLHAFMLTANDCRLVYNKKTGSEADLNSIYVIGGSFYRHNR